MRLFIHSRNTVYLFIHTNWCARYAETRNKYLRFLHKWKGCIFFIQVRNNIERNNAFHVYTNIKCQLYFMLKAFLFK